MSWRDPTLALGGIVVGMTYAIACGSGEAAPPAGAQGASPTVPAIVLHMMSEDAVAADGFTNPD